MLVRCLYASRIKGPLTPALLSEILAQSRKNNPLRGITGLLCYTPDVFVQVLEGSREEVSKLLNGLMLDPRHTDVTVLVYEEITERRFSGWTMGQVNIDTVNPGLLLKYSSRPRLDPFSGSGQTVMSLLLELIATGAIAG